MSTNTIILVLKCHDCGTELTRTRPLNPSQASLARVSSGLVNVACPKPYARHNRDIPVLCRDSIKQAESVLAELEKMP